MDQAGYRFLDYKIPVGNPPLPHEGPSQLPAPQVRQPQRHRTHVLAPLVGSWVHTAAGLCSPPEGSLRQFSAGYTCEQRLNSRWFSVSLTEVHRTVSNPPVISSFGL